MIITQWVNLEMTTLEVTIDGTTSYVVKTGDGSLTSEDDNVTAILVTTWMEEGNIPLPYYNPSLGG